MMSFKERMTKFLKDLFEVILACVILFFIVGEIVMPKENPTDRGQCDLYNGEWEVVYPDGKRESITLPNVCDAKAKEVVRLETVLPKEQEQTWFCMRASQQDMRVYIGDKLITEYTTKESRLFGHNSASGFVFFEVQEEYAGQVLAIELVSDSEYSGFLNEVYVGDRYNIINTFLHQCALVFSVSIFMLIVSSVVVFVGCILKLLHNMSLETTYLGLGCFQLSLAMIAESRLRQFFLPNLSIAAHVGFLLTILMPYPFMVYVNRLQKNRYLKVYHILSIITASNFFISTFLQLADIVDLTSTSIVSYVIIALMVIAVLVTICIDMRRGRILEYGDVIIGLIAMMLAFAWETYVSFYPETTVYGGVGLSIGLIVLLFTAVFKMARDMFYIEKEKQRAIAMGEAKTNFLANMSHEIRTPINTIIGMNEMILRENKDDSVEDYAKNVQNASKLLLGLINDVLDFSKIEAGKMEIVEGDYELAKMLTDVVNGTKIKAEAKGLEFKVRVDETLPLVLHGDEIRIRQVLNNLLSNAVKYTKEGEVCLKVEGEYQEEIFSLRFVVKDTGMGIKEKDLGKLFDSFQRLEEKKNRYIEGTGLGLSITKQLTELMGGNISVKSEYEKGSSFAVIIPQQIIDKTEIGKLEDTYKKDKRKKEVMASGLQAPEARVLVVDDNEMNLKVASALLKRTGVQVEVANGGMECLELCRKNNFDLIFMDHMMPEPDGIETLHMLRADETSLNKETEVVVLTANAIAGMEEEYLKEGFTAYLTKPIVAEDLEAMLVAHLPEEKINVHA